MNKELERILKYFYKFLLHVSVKFSIFFSLKKIFRGCSLVNYFHIINQPINMKIILSYLLKCVFCCRNICFTAQQTNPVQVWEVYPGYMIPLDLLAGFCKSFWELISMGSPHPSGTYRKFWKCTRRTTTCPQLGHHSHCEASRIAARINNPLSR